MASGTNDLHGDAFEILRNQLFDSSGFFPRHLSPDGNPTPPIDQQNNYGFTLGGPFIIPKLYNGKNRTFFHYSADWFKQNQAQNAIGTVPTAAMKTGDFSSFVDSSGTMIPIYDPQTGNPFPGNVIPQSRFSALASSVLPSIPDPDRTGVNFGLQSNKAPAISSVDIHRASYRALQQPAAKRLEQRAIRHRLLPQLRPHPHLKSRSDRGRELDRLHYRPGQRQEGRQLRSRRGQHDVSTG